jgi:hypothetical protein
VTVERSWGRPKRQRKSKGLSQEGGNYGGSLRASDQIPENIHY